MLGLLGNFEKVWIFYVILERGVFKLLKPMCMWVVENGINVVTLVKPNLRVDMWNMENALIIMIN